MPNSRESWAKGGAWVATTGGEGAPAGALVCACLLGWLSSWLAPKRRRWAAGSSRGTAALPRRKPSDAAKRAMDVLQIGLQLCLRSAACGGRASAGQVGRLNAKQGQRGAGGCWLAHVAGWGQPHKKT